MFENTPDEFKAKLIDVLITMEENYKVNDPKTLNAIDIGVVEYYTPEASGSIDLQITADDTSLYGPCSTVKYTDGNVKIVFKRDYFINSSNAALEAALAHELGHVVSGHFNKQIEGIPTLYRDEILELWNTGDRSAYIALTVKSIVDGGYLPHELEADVVGAKFAGLDSIITLHAKDMIGHGNATVMLEKLNRMRKLKSMFTDQDTPIPGYLFQINLLRPNENER